MNVRAFCLAIAIFVTMGASAALASPACPIDFGEHAGLKPHKLFLFFPATDVVDSKIFPGHGFDPTSKWLPLLKFDSSQLRAYSGTDAELRDAVHTAVTGIFCEFNVEVITTSDPPPTDAPHRNIIGIGSDSNPARPCSNPLFGEAFTAGGDPGNSTPIDFARIWAGAYTCPAFSHADLQLAGWTNAIAGSVAHEAAHNYGLSHEDGLGEAGDLDEREHHLMRGDGYTAQDRTKPRHFSNFETSVLARLIGLSFDTMWTWEFVNPNAEPVAKLQMELLSEDTRLVVSWVFSEETSPWVNPTLTGPSGVRRFEGRDYNVFQLEWTIPNGAWSGGPAGRVPPGKIFQVGATFSAVGKDNPDPVIIIDVTLLDENNQVLSKRPPWMVFDAGKFDRETGNLNVTFFNVFDQKLLLRDVTVRDLPRVMSINAMMRNKPITDIVGRPFVPWDKWGIRNPLTQATIDLRDDLKVAVANRSQGRHISVQRTDLTCVRPGRGLHCHTGITADDLFPATTMYITGTVVDETGNESQFYYQVAGRRAPLP